MARLFLLFLFSMGFTAVSPAQDTLLVEQSQRQINQYIQAVQNGDNSPINLWALAQLSQSREDLRRNIATQMETVERITPALAVFKDTTLSEAGQLQQLAFASKSPFLLTAYLLAETDDDNRRKVVRRYRSDVGFPAADPIDFDRLTKALIQQQPITTSVLPADSFNTLHFLLFLDSDLVYDGGVPREYLTSAAKKWNPTDAYDQRGLQRSLFRATLFRTHYILDQYGQIETLFDAIIEDELFPNSDRKLSLLRMMDYSIYQLGYYNRSVDLSRNLSLPLARYLGLEELAVNLYMDLGASLNRIGNIKEAQKIYSDIKSQLLEGYTDISKAQVLNNLAITYWRSGEFDRFLSLEFEALESTKRENDYELNFDILRNLFTHYRINQDFTSAKQYLTEAKDLATKEENNQDLGQISFFEGQFFRYAQSNFVQANQSFDKALSFLSVENNYDFYQIVLKEKAFLFRTQGQYKKAKEINSQILKKAEEREDSRFGIYGAYSKANMHLALGQLDSARVMLDSLQTKDLEALDFFQLVMAKTVQARYRQDINQPRDGSNLLQPVVEQILQRSRSSGDLETGFWQIEPEYLDAFELYADLLIDTGRPGQAVEVLDRFKNINDAAIYQNPLVRSKVLNEEELSEYQRLTEQLDALRRELLAASEDNTNDIQQDIDERSARKNALSRKITANADSDPVSVSQVQRQLDAYRRVLHITEINDTFYMAVISRNSVDFKKIPITPKMRSRFEQSIAEMAKGDTDLSKLYSITQMLQLNELPAHVNRLTIIPDSYLYQLSMDVLPLSAPSNSYSYGQGDYLIEHYETNYLTSLGDFNSPKSGETAYTYGFAGYGVSSFGDDRKALVPLPEAGVEVESISNKLTAFNDRKSFLNAGATEQSFRENAPKARILHMATHSEVSGQDPMFSSIYLSRSDTDDPSHNPGRIFAYELFEMNLSNELIMLNSCESGSGSYLQGTGVVGISRALRYAGAKSLVLNLWSVNDMMASDFAVKFYEGINDGLSKSDALRSAKLHFLKVKNANPHYWGTYMLLGDEKPLLEPDRYARNIIAGSFMIFFFIMVTASTIIDILSRNRTDAV
jgi:CHAT domain-containing protein